METYENLYASTICCINHWCHVCPHHGDANCKTKTIKDAHLLIAYMSGQIESLTNNIMRICQTVNTSTYMDMIDKSRKITNAIDKFDATKQTTKAMRSGDFDYNPVNGLKKAILEATANKIKAEYCEGEQNNE